MEQHSDGATIPSTTAWDANERLIEHMQVAKMLLEQQQEPKQAMLHAQKALSFCTSDALHARCKLLYALAFRWRPAFKQTTDLFSQNIRHENSFSKRKVLLIESIKNFVEAVRLDPHDDLTHFFCSLEHAEGRQRNKKSIQHLLF